MYVPTFWHAFWTRRQAIADGGRSYPASDSPHLSETETKNMERTESTRWKSVRAFNSEAASLGQQRAQSIRDRHELDVEWKAISSRAGRTEPLIHVGVFWFYAIGLLIALGEAALNSVAFTVFASNPIEAFLMGFVLGVVLLVIAEFAGTKIRQWPTDVPWYRHATHALKVTAALFLVGITLHGVQWLRAQYVAAEGSSTSLGAGLDSALYAVNWIIFAGTMVLAYRSSDPVEGFVDTKTKLAKVDEKLVVLAGKLDRAKTDLIAEIGVDENVCRQLLFLYRRANRRSRPSGNPAPDYFDNPKAEQHRPSFRPLSFTEKDGTISATLVEIGGEPQSSTTLVTDKAAIVAQPQPTEAPTIQALPTAIPMPPPSSTSHGTFRRAQLQ